MEKQNLALILCIAIIFILGAFGFAGYITPLEVAVYGIIALVIQYIITWH